MTDIYQLVFFLTRRLHITFWLAVWLLAGDVYALSYLKVDIGSVTNSQTEIRGLSATLNKLDEHNSRIELSTQKYVPKEQPRQQLNDISVICEQLELADDVLRCNKAGFSFSGQTFKASQGALSFNYSPATNTGHLQLTGLQVFAGELSGRLSYQKPSLKASVKFTNLQLNQDNLVKLIPGMPTDIAFESRMNGNVDLNLQAGSLASEYDIAIENLTFSNQQGDFLGDSLAMKLIGRHRLSNNAHRLQKADLSLSHGELLTPYFYSDFKQRPLSIGIKNTRLHDDKTWVTDQFSLSDNVVVLSAKNLNGTFDGLQSGVIELKQAGLQDVYDFYFLPVISNELAQVAVEGNLTARVTVDDQKISAYQLKFSDINLQHKPATGVKKFRFENLHGHFVANDDAVTKSYLHFDRANLLETIDFGATDIPLDTSSQSISLSGTTELPVLDGQLMVEKFSLDFSTASPAVEFEGQLTPVSLPLITKALDWPEMQGKISGIIPAVSYRQRNAKIDGTLLVKVFDGNILLKNVQASHLLSAWPVLKADVEFIGIDLEQLTQTFEFGRITGNVDGQINRLVLENWEPTSFDASFESSEKSKRKRISQKAVDNISNLGGVGVAGALSRTFMRFFEDFGYDKLGFSCKLRDGVCEMDGVADANQGYYLVKGGGIPRIDVIGHNRQTDWNILVNRLIDITEAGTPDIQ